MQNLIRQDAAVEIIIQTVLDSLDSAHSRRAYERQLRQFITWHHSTGQTALSKAIVQSYAAELREAGLSPATINQRLSAIPNSRQKRLTTARWMFRLRMALSRSKVSAKKVRAPAIGCRSSKHSNYSTRRT